MNIFSSVIIIFFIVFDLQAHAVVRDPFVVQVKNAKSKQTREIILCGIAWEQNKRGALLCCNGKSKFVFDQQEFFGFKLDVISKDFVRLSQENRAIKLFLDEG